MLHYDGKHGGQGAGRRGGRRRRINKNNNFSKKVQVEIKATLFVTVMYLPPLSLIFFDQLDISV